MSKKTFFKELLREQRLLQFLREPAITAPVIGRGAAAVRNDEAQRREILEQVALNELHHRGRVGVDVMGAGGVEAGVAAGRDMHHRRDVPLHHLLIDWIPVPIGQRRARPVAAGRIGVEIDGDEAVVPDAFFEFGNASLRIDAWALRQHRRADEMVGKQLGDAEAELVADRGPGRTHGEIADVMGHEAGAGAEDRQIAAALPHQAQLVRFDRLREARRR